MTGDVLVERAGPTVLLTYNRPDARNAMTFEMYEALHDTCANLDADPSVRVLVLKGVGDRAFASGTDIRQFLDFTTRTLGNFLTPEPGIIGRRPRSRPRPRARAHGSPARCRRSQGGRADRPDPPSAGARVTRARARRTPRRAGAVDPRGDEGSHPPDAGRADASRPRRSHSLVLSQPGLPRRGARLSGTAQTGLAGPLNRASRARWFSGTPDVANFSCWKDERWRVSSSGLERLGTRVRPPAGWRASRGVGSALSRSRLRTPRPAEPASSCCSSC